MVRLKQGLLIFAAMNGVGGGVAVFLHCGLGSDPIGLLCEGIHNFLNIRYGHASLLYNAVVILLALFAAKENLGAGTLVYAVCSGYFIDFYYWILGPFQLGELDFIWKLSLYFVGQLLLSFALALLIRFRLGMNALDALLYRAEALTKIPYGVLRTGCDLLYTVFGFLLGGIFGVGTLVSVFTTGFLVRLFIKRMKEETPCQHHTMKQRKVKLQKTF